ncbi:MAG: hypothetical protein WCL03_05510 [Bacteroidota bacterium]
MLLFLLVFSCKKKDDTPDPPAPIPTPTQKDVFTNDKLAMMSDYEINNRKSLQAFGMYNHLNNGFGGPMEWFEKGFGIFSSIKDYQNTEYVNQQLANINQSLGQIQNEIGQLQTDFTNLAAELNFDMTTLMSEVYQLNMLAATAPIITAYSNASQNGFRWFADQAKSHNSGSPTDVDYINKTLNPAMINFATLYTSGTNATTLQTAMVNLNGYFLPSATSTGLLSVLARNIVAQQKTAAPLSQYIVLENYFLQLLNYQFQAAVVQLNCFTINDTVSYTSFSNYTKEMIISEVTLFLQATNFLSVSLHDYRNQAQYNNDVLNYLYTGLAPETNTGPMMSRAQFVANLIYNACGIPAPVMCGSIILPHFYNAGTGKTPLGIFNVEVAGRSLNARTDTVIKSPIPYTIWTMNQISNLQWDNQWNVFNYGSFGTTDAGWTGNPQTIQILDAPWGNTRTPAGSITPLWYNPRDPSQTSTSKSDSCVVQFAYFAASWKWGYLGPCLANGNLRSTSILDDMTWDCHTPPICPFVQQWHSSQGKFETSGGDVGVRYLNNCLFQENFFGNFGTYSSGWIYAAEFTYFNAQAAADLGAGLTLFINYNYSFLSGGGTLFNNFTYAIGTGVRPSQECGMNYESTKDIVNEYSSETSVGMTRSGATMLQVGTGLQQLSFQIQLGMHDLPNTNNASYNTQTNIYAQYVYNGRATNY